MAERSNRRLAVAGSLAGLALGAAVGISALSGAAPQVIGGIRPTVLHVTKVLAVPGADLELAAGLICSGPAAGGCRATGAVAHVLPAGGGGWTEVPGVADDTAWRFRVPDELVGTDGLAYWLELRIEGGGVARLPEAGAEQPFRVVTTAGLPQVAWPVGFDWSRVTRPDGVVARLGYGSAEGLVGRVGGSGDGQALGPSSFDVGPDGSLHLADWVHRRIVVLSPKGEYVGSVPLPAPSGVTVDLSVDDGGGYAVTTLGLGATAFELESDGRVIGRYEVPGGVAERIVATPGGPRVWVGPAQWAPVRSAPGVALPAEAQLRSLAPAVPARDGSVALSQDLDERTIAFVWTRPDGSRAGAVLTLPDGVQIGVDHFVAALPDGGAIAARGVWGSDGRQALVLLRFRSDGSIAEASLVAPPSDEMDAPASAVRFRAPDEVLVVRADDHALRIERHEVTA
jgi:hypothetical protein